jgi:hypothetical protein
MRHNRWRKVEILSAAPKRGLDSKKLKTHILVWFSPEQQVQLAAFQLAQRLIGKVKS